MTNIFAKKKIRTKKTLGNILKSARNKKQLTLEKAELDTKIRLKYLKFLEEDDFKNMPPDVYNIGFLTRYAEYLGLNVDKIINQYQNERLLYNQLNKKIIFFNNEKKLLFSPGDKNRYREKLKFIITPQIFVSFLIATTVFIIIGYIWFQVKSFAAAPQLELSNPAEQILVSENSINISGQTDLTATIKINDQLIVVDENGKFNEQIQLNRGINSIEIKAINKANKETKKTIKILVVNDENYKEELGE